MSTRTGRNDNSVLSDIHTACCYLEFQRIRELIEDGHKWYSMNIRILSQKVDENPEEVYEIIKFLTIDNANRQGDRFISSYNVKYNNDYNDNYYDYIQFQPCIDDDLYLVKFFENLGYPVNSIMFEEAVINDSIEVVKYLIETEQFSESDIDRKLLRIYKGDDIKTYLESL